MRALIVSGAFFFAACGPGGFGGTVAGQPLAVRDSVFAILKNQGMAYATYVVLSDVPGICELAKANRNPKNATFASFGMIRKNGTAILAPDVGEYTVTPTIFSPGDTASVLFAKNDANCTNTVAAGSAGGKSGLVKITALKAEAGGTMAGNFDVTFGDQNDKVTGVFNATFCDVSTMPTSCE